MRWIGITFIFALLSCDSKEIKLSGDTEMGKLLVGKWEMISSSKSYAYHPPSCARIGEGTIFEFTLSGEIKVFRDDEDELYPCNGDQFFWVKDKALTFFELESSWQSEILKLTETQLAIRTEALQPNLAIWSVYGIWNCTPEYDSYVPKEDFVMNFKKIL
ncbi:MAG: hypothetical protein Aureis2KO_14950 [Aureisphaera sp.]